VVGSNKDPTADTSFLPDRAREAEEASLRLKLQEEWKHKQELIKKEQIQIVYSYVSDNCSFWRY
jgi:protein FAM50